MRARISLLDCPTCGLERWRRGCPRSSIRLSKITPACVLRSPWQAENESSVRVPTQRGWRREIIGPLRLGVLDHADYVSANESMRWPRIRVSTEHTCKILGFWGWMQQ